MAGIAALREQWLAECFYVGAYTGEPLWPKTGYLDFPVWLRARGESVALAWWEEQVELCTA